MLHEGSAAVVKTLIPRASVIFRKSSLANSPPLLTRTFCGEPFNATHIRKNSFMIVSLLLWGMKVDADRRVQRSIIYKIKQASYCYRSISIDSWNCGNMRNNTHGLGSGFLYFFQISQLSVTFFISLFRFIFWCFFYCTVNQGLQFLNRWMCKMVKFCEVKWWSAISLSDLYLMSHRAIWCWLRLLLNLFISCLGAVLIKHINHLMF